jgi:hypothetical protein
MPDLHSGIATAPNYGTSRSRRWRGSLALGLLVSLGAAAGGFYWSQHKGLEDAAGVNTGAAHRSPSAAEHEPPVVEADPAPNSSAAASADVDEPEKISLDEVAEERPPERDAPEQAKTSSSRSQESRAAKASSGRKNGKKAKKIPKNPYEF